MSISDLIDERPFTRRVHVRTPGVLQGSITVWHVKQFVDALVTAGIPDSAQVNSRRADDSYHLIELSVYMEETL